MSEFNLEHENKILDKKIEQAKKNNKSFHQRFIELLIKSKIEEARENNKVFIQSILEWLKNSNIEQANENNKSFDQRFIEWLIKSKIVSGKDFFDKTLLNGNQFSTLKKSTNTDFEVETLMAVCVGYDLDLAASEELMAASGRVLKVGDETHEAYKYILERFPGESIDVRNEFLKSRGIKPLGSKSRDEK